MATTEEKNHALDQAKCQCSSIIEMVRKLDRQTVAEDYAKTLTRDQLLQLVDDNEGTDATDSSDEELRERIADELANGKYDAKDFEFDEDAARQGIDESPLEIIVRSGWVAPGTKMVAEEALILLCTGGPACRIICDVDSSGELDRPRIEYQDWGTPWTEYFPTSDERSALELYVGCFSVYAE